ncbi:MAG: SDR family NAD(P)-dependent oxidoreductase [Syntrophobacteraceae bacterium]
MKKAIVVGASSGIGLELAKVLSKDGYAVGVMARRVHLLEELRNETGALVRQIDVKDTESAMQTLAAFIEEIGSLDLIVISAGTGKINTDLRWEMEKEVIETNVVGFAAIANVAMHHFIAKGSGHLVGISSIAALRGWRDCPAYNASKAFESNHMEGLRQKVRKLRLPITITDIKPGWVETAMGQGEGVFWAAPADKAAIQIYAAIKRKSSHAYITRRWRLIAWLLRIIPGSIYERA